MAQHTGTVAWFNNAKGFRFLKPTSGPDVFAHYSSIKTEGFKSLTEGDLVDFDIVIGSSGKPQAANVQVVKIITTASYRLRRAVPSSEDRLRGICLAMVADQ